MDAPVKTAPASAAPDRCRKARRSAVDAWLRKITADSLLVLRACSRPHGFETSDCHTSKGRAGDLRGQLGATWRRLFCGRGGTPASKVRDKPTERLIHAEAKAQTDDPAELCRKGNALAAYGIALRLVSCRVRRAQYAQGAGLLRCFAKRWLRSGKRGWRCLNSISRHSSPRWTAWVSN
jgi:hypothetical protein